MVDSLLPLIGKFFTPPAMPPIELPWPAKMSSSLRSTLTQAAETIYFAGVKDGFTAGVIVALVFAFAIHSLKSSK